MSNIWFTADTHFGHKRIIELCNRPFSSVVEMDLEMIRRWNRRVMPKDEIIHLGDFSMGPQDKYLHQLNGRKILIKGNHDYSKNIFMATEAFPEGWQSVCSLLEVPVDDVVVTMCHYAMRTWNKAHKDTLQLYGHSHGKTRGNRQSLDVGVDCWDFQPVSLDEIRARMATLPVRVVDGDPI